MVYLLELNSKEVDRYRRSVLVIPFAAIENHGPLPIGTDIMIAKCIIEKIIDKYNRRIVIAPITTVTISVEHMGMDATVSVSSTTFMSYALELLKGYARIFNRILLIAFHGGVYHALILLAREIRNEIGSYIDIFSPFEVIEQYLKSLYNISNIVIHADCIEASLLLACEYKNCNIIEKSKYEVLNELRKERYDVPKPWIWRDVFSKYCTNRIIASKDLGIELLTRVINSLCEKIEKIAY